MGGRKLPLPPQRSDAVCPPETLVLVLRPVFLSLKPRSRLRVLHVVVGILKGKDSHFFSSPLDSQSLRLHIHIDTQIFVNEKKKVCAKEFPLHPGFCGFEGQLSVKQ